MTTTAQHTPLPWSAKKVPTAVGVCYKVGSQETINHPQGGICLYDDDTSRRPEKPGEQEANAALIVRAVNSHADLVAALKGLLRYVNAVGDGSNAEEALCEDARAALAKATL